MIRINLLGVERQRARRSPTFDVGQRLTVACSLIVVVAALLIGWWYWSLSEESARLDTEIATAQQEAARLKSLLGEVQKFEARRAQLQQRVALIEELRKGQSVPVRLLDHVSRSIPDMLWLTQMRQEGRDVTIEGRSTTLMGVSDLVANLGTSDIFVKPIEIVSSQLDTAQGARAADTVDVVRFTVKATLAPVAPVAAAAAPAAR